MGWGGRPCIHTAERVGANGGRVVSPHDPCSSPASFRVLSRYAIPASQTTTTNEYLAVLGIKSQEVGVILVQCKSIEREASHGIQSKPIQLPTRILDITCLNRPVHLGSGLSFLLRQAHSVVASGGLATFMPARSLLAITTSYETTTSEKSAQSP